MLNLNAVLKSGLVVGLLMVGLGSVAAGQELPRRAAFGGQLGPAPEGQAGIEVLGVQPDSPAAKGGLKPGDIIVAMDGSPVPGPAEFVARLARHRAGDRLALRLLRGTTESEQSILLEPLPRETSTDYDVRYDAVQVGSSRLRSVVYVPRSGGPRHPAVLLAGGIGCSSLDVPYQKPQGYVAILQAFARAGFVTLRIDKSGVGDSEGPACSQQDFTGELAGYREALRTLMRYEFVDPAKVFVFGHSIGGVVAPHLAAEFPLRGVVAVATVGHKWFDYEVENTRRQAKLRGRTGEELEKEVALRRECAGALLSEKKSLDEVLKITPGCGPVLAYPVHYRYIQQVADLDIPALWSRVTAKVLLVYGASDFVTSVEDHEIVRDAVNRTHPGLAELRVMPNLDHFLRPAASQAESWRNSQQATAPVMQPALIEAVTAWLRQESATTTAR